MPFSKEMGVLDPVAHGGFYRSVRAVVRVIVWSVLAVAVLGWGIAGVWFVWGVVK